MLLTGNFEKPWLSELFVAFTIVKKINNARYTFDWFGMDNKVVNS